MRSAVSLLIGIYQRCSQRSESRIEKQTRDSLTSFYRLHSQEFLESVIDVAFGENPPQVSRGDDSLGVFSSADGRFAPF